MKCCGHMCPYGIEPDSIVRQVLTKGQWPALMSIDNNLSLKLIHSWKERIAALSQRQMKRRNKALYNIHPSYLKIRLNRIYSLSKSPPHIKHVPCRILKNKCRVLWAFYSKLLPPSKPPALKNNGLCVKSILIPDALMTTLHPYQ